MKGFFQLFRVVLSITAIVLGAILLSQLAVSSLATEPSVTPHPTVTPTPASSFDAMYWGKMGFYWTRSHGPVSQSYVYFASGEKTQEFVADNYPSDSEVWFHCESPIATSTSLPLTKISPLIESCESGYMFVRIR